VFRDSPAFPHGGGCHETARARGTDMSEPLTPFATHPPRSAIDAALAEIERTEPTTIDPARFARVGGEVVPLPPVAEAATSLESEDDSE